MNANLEQRVLTLPVRAAEIHIRNQTELTLANDFILGIKVLQKEVQAVFNPIVDAAHKAHQEAIDQKKKFMEPIERAEKTIKSKLVEYLNEQEMKRHEAEKAARQAEQAQKREEPEAPFIPLAPIPLIPEKQRTEGLSMREEWDFEIIDVSAIPREYLIPNEVEIRRVIKATKGQVDIPGVRAFSRKVLSARTL